MPSAKPSKEAITALRARRKVFHPSEPSPEYHRLHSICGRAVNQGYLIPEDAQTLLDALRSFAGQSSQFPARPLIAALNSALAPDGWSPEVELALLRYITGFYLSEADDALLVLQDFFQGPHPLFGDLYQALFDPVPPALSVKDSFVAFTGPFSNCPKRVLYQQAESLGAVATDGGWFLDCLFVSDAHVQKGAISNKIMSAVETRSRYSVTKIYPESVWHGLLEL